MNKGILITRPEPEASRWAAILQTNGYNAQALPLIAIKQLNKPQWLPFLSEETQTAMPNAASDRALLSIVQQQTANYRAVMFVSGSAVRCFWNASFDLEQSFLSENRAIPLYSSRQIAMNLGSNNARDLLRVWAPGLGTKQALLKVGICEKRIDCPSDLSDSNAQFDSEHLWSLVRGQIQKGDAVLIVRGRSQLLDQNPPDIGREWLAKQLAQAGVQVMQKIVYERQMPEADAQNSAQAQQARAASQNGNWWLFSSSEAVRHLCAWLPDVHWKSARAICTHPRIANVAKQMGFSRVELCHPVLESVQQTLDQLSS